MAVGVVKLPANQNAVEGEVDLERCVSDFKVPGFRILVAGC
jgi:hypothetical protein